MPRLIRDPASKERRWVEDQAPEMRYHVITEADGHREVYVSMADVQAWLMWKADAQVSIGMDVTDPDKQAQIGQRWAALSVAYDTFTERLAEVRAKHLR